jgi:hypothetical protein
MNASYKLAAARSSIASASLLLKFFLLEHCFMNASCKLAAAAEKNRSKRELVVKVFSIGTLFHERELQARSCRILKKSSQVRACSSLLVSY